MEQKQPTLFTPILRWFLGTMILANVAARMVFTFLPVYIAEQLGASVSQVGLVYTLAGILPVFLQLFGGWLSDTIGRLRTIAIGAVIATFGYFGIALASSWEWIVVALMLEYVSGAAVGPSFGAFLADQSTEANRGKVFGTVQSLYMIVGVAGPPLGGFLTERFGFQTMMLAAAVMYGSAAILRILMAVKFRQQDNRTAETSEPLTWASFKLNFGKMLTLFTAGSILTWILVTDGVRDIAFTMSREMEPLYFANVGGLDVQQIGNLSSILHFALMIFIAPSGWLSDKISERYAIMIGLLVQFGGFVVFLNAASFMQFAVSSFLLGTSFALMGPAYDSLISKAVPEDVRGMAYGLFQTSFSVIALPAPYLGALLWEQISPQTPFIITAIFALLMVGPVYAKFKLENNREILQ